MISFSGKVALEILVGHTGYGVFNTSGKISGQR